MLLPKDNPSAMNHPIVDASGLFFSYKTKNVLQNIHFKIYPGEFIGVIGPNGGGKTTLLKLIMGFLQLTQGHLKVFGESPIIKAGQLSKIAYVPQSMRYDKDFPISVMEVVLSGRLSHLPWYGSFRKEDRQAAMDALEQVRLVHLAQASFGTLSGGQAQRVLIARALVSQPQLLLLDEPTASVDQQAEAEIYSVLSELKGKMTILMVTHDLKAALDVVERILCVQGGVVSLKPQEVCEHFALGLYHIPLMQSSISSESSPNNH
ncbi:MAG: ABC transporter ATP-binding protein [Parachlamydiaceae bacterium]|nr:ABC transporter ATP-binding protein [Parachlamydiaceae bacterium]